MSPRSTPRPLGDSLRELRTRSQPATLLAAVQGCWLEAVGERIAAHAGPVRERDGMITVECTAATWAQELDLLQPELLMRVNEALGEARVDRLRMVVGQSRGS